jgi:hypothetical protein
LRQFIQIVDDDTATDDGGDGSVAIAGITIFVTPGRGIRCGSGYRGGGGGGGGGGVIVSSVLCIPFRSQRGVGDGGVGVPKLAALRPSAAATAAHAVAVVDVVREVATPIAATAAAAAAAGIVVFITVAVAVIVVTVAAAVSVSSAHSGGLCRSQTKRDS